MRRQVQIDLDASSKDFVRVVWPEMGPALGGGHIQLMEADDESRFAKQCDTLSGVDAWQFDSKHGLRGIASRIQWMDTSSENYLRMGPYNGFSIRYSRPNNQPTEYAKRCEAIKNGWLYPYYTIQAYVALPRGEGELLSCAAISTKTLFQLLMDIEADTQFIDIGKRKRFGIRPNPRDNVNYLYIYWGHLLELLPPKSLTIIDRASLDYCVSQIRARRGHALD